jgi:tRNA1(Val) A37 N6-methylase TrmN6
LGPLYQDLFPRPLRRQLGEYYTPDWLARHVLDQVGYTGQPTQRLLDPACGSGTFLVMALRRLRHSSFVIRHFPIVGFDLNPLAVLSARANYLLAVADLLPRLGPVEIPVYLHDSIQDRGEGAVPQFDYVVGNPPWIAWDNLSDEDRRATKPLWEQYGLFSLSGSQARHGGGKKDLSMLMLYAAADRYLKPGGRLGMVVTQTVFQTLAGDGFRRFRLGREGPPLRVLRVDDLTALRPFGDAANWTSTIVLEKGAATEYPVPYFRWTEEKGEGGRGKGKRRFRQEACVARPIDPRKPTSPWLVLEQRAENSGQPLAASQEPAGYTAHLGANSGGANGVYWVEVLGEAPGGLLVRNIAAKGKHPIDVVEAVIEPGLLYPLLRWGGVGRYRATPGGCILLAQDPATRAGIEEAVMRARWPRTLAYLERFRDLLAARAAFRRYQHGGPFYSMYNVGPYTTAPVKVVWRRMDRRINAAVVETLWCSPHPGPLPEGEGTVARPVIPQETCVLVACDSTDEAHYLCAMLNSAAVNALAAAHSVRGGKSFGTPGMLAFLRIRRFRPDHQRHRQLAALGRQAHAELLARPRQGSGAMALPPFVRGEGQGERAAAGESAVADIQRHIDRLAEDLWRQ